MVARIALLTFVRLIGKYPSVDDQIDLAQCQMKLTSRITSHQSQARKFLDLTDTEEEEDLATFQDTHIFAEGEDGDLILIRNPVDIASGDLLKPETFNIAMPSILGLPACQARNLDALVQAEIQLRVGQCNDALQVIRLFIGRKAFIFKTDVRSAATMAMKTRSYRKIQNLDSTLRHHAQLYHRSRAALGALAASPAILSRFKDLKPEDLKAKTTFIDSSVKGVKHKHLSWFWYLDIEGDTLDDNVMRECLFFSLSPVQILTGFFI